MRRQRRISILSRQRRARNVSDGFHKGGIVPPFFPHCGNSQPWNFHGSQHAIIAQRACRAIRGNQRSVRVRGRLRFSRAPHRGQHRFFPMLMNGRPGVRHRTIPNCDDSQHPQTNLERFQQGLIAIRHRCLENSPRELRHLRRLGQPAIRLCTYFFKIHAHPQNFLGVLTCREPRLAPLPAPAGNYVKRVTTSPSPCATSRFPPAPIFQSAESAAWRSPSPAKAARSSSPPFVFPPPGHSSSSRRKPSCSSLVPATTQPHPAAHWGKHHRSPSSESAYGSLRQSGPPPCADTQTVPPSNRR